MAKAILRLPLVKARTGLSRSAIYARMAEGSFPRTVSLGPRTVGWEEAQIDEWISQRIEESRAGSSK